MKVLLGSVLAIFLVTGSASAFECPIGAESKLMPLEWSAEKKDDEWTSTQVNVKNAFDKDISFAMARAFYVGPFSGAGEEFGGMVILSGGAPAGEVVTVKIEATNLKELVGAEQGAFQLHICVQAVSFTDGTRANF